MDPIPTWLLKQLSDTLTPVITSLCNSSLSSGLFPDLHKPAIVLPRLKKPSLDSSNLSSYRPISNLSFLSKLVERVVASRFIGHANEENRLFPVHQSSHRHGHSTETAMLCVHNDIVRAVDQKPVDQKRIVALVLLDLSAAFDTVDHATLLSVLQTRFEVDGAAVTWFESYLSDRFRGFWTLRLRHLWK